MGEKTFLLKNEEIKIKPIFKTLSKENYNEKYHDEFLFVAEPNSASKIFPIEVCE